MMKRRKVIIVFGEIQHGEEIIIGERGGKSDLFIKNAVSFDFWIIKCEIHSIIV